MSEFAKYERRPSNGPGEQGATLVEPPVMQQADEAVALLQDVLGSNLLAAYIHGSALRGGLQPHSDLDILAVTNSRLKDGDRAALVHGLLWISSPKRPGRPLEVTIVATAEAKPWRHPVQREFQYGEWLREPLEADDLDRVAPVIDPDLTLLIAMVLDASWPLYGRPAQSVFEAVPTADIKAALLDELPAVVRWTATDTRNALLTLARIWSTLSDGRFYSKAEAAAWAIDQLPVEHQPVLLQALAAYLGGLPEQWDDLATDIQRHTEYVVHQIRRATPQPR